MTKKLIILLVGVMLYFGPAIVLTSVYGNALGAALWLMGAWMLALLCMEWLED